MAQVLFGFCLFSSRKQLHSHDIYFIYCPTCFTSLSFHPKLSVRSVVLTAFSSRSIISANKRCKYIGITRTCNDTYKRVISHYTSHSKHNDKNNMTITQKIILGLAIKINVNEMTIIKFNLGKCDMNNYTYMYSLCG